MTLLMREQEIREEGIRASVKMLKSLHIPEQTMIEQLVEQFQLTEEEAISFIKEE